MRSASLRRGLILGASLAIAGVYYSIKTTVAPFYWPGGDYLNHLQNANMLLKTALGGWGRSFEPYAANAWWQSIGAALYLIATGVPLLKTFKVYIFMQGFMAGLSMVLIFDLMRRHGALLAAACSATLFMLLLTYFENPQNNLNICLQAIALCAMIRLLEPGAAWTERRLLWLSLLLVALNLVRASGFLLFAAFLAVFVAQGLWRGFPTRWKPAMAVFLSSYLALNLASGALFGYRMDRVDTSLADDAECYLDYGSRVMTGTYAVPAGTDLAALRERYMSSGRTEFPYAAFGPEEDLKRLVEQVPTYSTFRIAQMAGDLCKDTPRWLAKLKRLPALLLLGDVPPRAGRQLMVTLQAAPARSSGAYSFALSKHFGADMEADLRASLTKFVETPFYRTATFVFEHFDKFYRQNVQPFVDSLTRANPAIDRSEFERDKALSLLGLRSVWANAGADTIAEGFIYTMFGATAGPAMTERLYMDHARRFFEYCASCRWLLVENLVCEAQHVAAPFPALGVCHVGTPMSWLVAGPKINSRDGLPPALAAELVAAPIPNDSVNAHWIAYLYYASIIAGAAMVWAMALGLFTRRTRARLLWGGVQLLLLVAAGKIAFLTLFAAIGDMRYSDEVRLFVVMLCPMLLGPGGRAATART